jgi:hypothetical protein
MAMEPIRRLELAGAARERGRRHGELLAGEIRRMRRGLLSYLAKISLGLGTLPLFWLLLRMACRYWPHIPGRLQEELLGVAAGAQVGLGTILLINVIDDLSHNLAGCSALAVGESHTENGVCLMGRTLDYPLFVDLLIKHQMLFVMEPDAGQPLASLAWPGYVGVCTGLNRAGVALAQLAAMTTDRSYQGVPAALRFRQALESEATVAGVASRILRTAGTMGNYLMLCGPREALALEMSAHRGVVRYPDAGLLTATNHFQTAAMEPVKAPHPQRLPFSPLSDYHFTEDYSRARDRRLRELAQGRTLDAEEIHAILADPDIANPGTAVCTIFSPAAGTLWVARADRAPVSLGPLEAVKLWE